MTYNTDPGIAEAVRYLMEQQELVRAPKRDPLPAPILGGGGAPTVTIAAYNATDYSKGKADLLCTGYDDAGTLNRGLAILASKLADSGDSIGGRILLTEGDFYLPSTITLYRGVRIEGLGQGGTRLHSAWDAALSTPSNQTMFYVEHSAGVGSFEPVSISHLDMDGHKAIQTSGSPSGVYCEPNGGSTVTLTDLNVHDFRGRGMYFDRCADSVTADRCRIYGNSLSGVQITREGEYKFTNCYVGQNTLHGVQGDGAEIQMFGCWLVDNVQDGFSSGGILQHPGQVIVGNHFEGNRTAIAIDGEVATVAANFITDNLNGISAAGHEGVAIVANTVHANDAYGIQLVAGSGTRGGVVSSNVVSRNGQHGIRLLGFHWLVQGNRVESNGQSANNTYDGIVVASGATDNAILNNLIRQDASAAKQRYGLNIQAGAVNTFAAGNDARAGGFVTAAYVDAGTASVLAWAGGFGDNI